MNFDDLQNECWWFHGCHDAGNRVDWRRQKIRNAINETLIEIAQTAPFLLGLVRETSIAIVAGTETYYVNDWLERPLEFFTKDDNAHLLSVKIPRNLDRDGSRAPGASYGSLGPYQLERYERNQSAIKSGASGAGTGVTCTEGAASVTKSGGTAWDADDVGRMFRFNGEDVDYKILSVGGANSLTLDKNVRAKITGLGVVGFGLGYTNARWEIGPPGRYRFRLVPAPTVASTLYCRYLARPRLLVNGDETPELPDGYHHLIWKGALRIINNFNEDGPSWQRFAQEYDRALEMLKANDGQDEGLSDDPPHYESNLDSTEYDRSPVDASYRYRY